MTDNSAVGAYDAYLLHFAEGSWLAQLADLPGAYATGASQGEALARLTAAIPAYYAWLRQHDEYTPITHDTPQVVVREVAEAPGGPMQAPTVFFSGDAEPVSEEDLDWWLAALDWAYDDLVAQARGLPPSAQGVLLSAVILMQRNLVVRCTGKELAVLVAPPTFPGADPLEQVGATRRATIAAFRVTTAEQRAAVREAGSERWSVRRGLRESALLARRATDDLAGI